MQRATYAAYCNACHTYCPPSSDTTARRKLWTHIENLHKASFTDNDNCRFLQCSQSMALWVEVDPSPWTLDMILAVKNVQGLSSLHDFYLTTNGRKIFVMYYLRPWSPKRLKTLSFETLLCFPQHSKDILHEQESPRLPWNSLFHQAQFQH